jgi:hypothetical protein
VFNASIVCLGVLVRLPTKQNFGLSKILASCFGSIPRFMKVPAFLSITGISTILAICFDSNSRFMKIPAFLAITGIPAILAIAGIFP